MRSEANFSSITCSTSGSGISSPLFCFNSNSAICALASFSLVSAVSFCASVLGPPCTPISRPRHPITALMSYQPRFSFGQPCRSQVPTVFVDTCMMSASVDVLTIILPSSVSSMRLLFFGRSFGFAVCTSFKTGLSAFGFACGRFLFSFNAFACVSFFIGSQSKYGAVNSEGNFKNFDTRLDAGCPTIVTATPTRRTRARFCVHNLCFLNTSNYCVTLCFTGYTYIIACAGR